MTKPMTWERLQRLKAGLPLDEEKSPEDLSEKVSQGLDKLRSTQEPVSEEERRSRFSKLQRAMRSVR